MKKKLLTLLLACTALSLHAQLVINEIMQSNIDCIMDDMNQYPDSWVELYNSGTTALDLGQYRLGETDDAAAAWQLPSQMIAPKHYIIIYCDKEATGLHTDFRLESGKNAEVHLFQGTTPVDYISGLKKQPAPNIAYGRSADGASTWGYQLKPSPGAANSAGVGEKLLGEPVFSQKGCVVKQGQSLQLSISLPADAPEGTVICYTTNGSEPVETGRQFTPGNTITINSNTVIRARLFCEGYLSPRSTVHSYIFFPTTRELTLPVISIVTDNRNLNDQQIGIFYKNTSKADDDRTQNYFQDWRRPINFEYFEGAGSKSLLNQLCETRVQGGATRTNPLKSLAIYAHKRFGTKRFEYEFFPDQRPGATEFKSLVLRNSGNDFDYLYQRDGIMQRAMGEHTDLDWQAWRPAIIYINGTYKGILNIRERSNEDNIYTHYDGLEDLDLIENWNELKEGTWDNYEQFKAFYAEHGHTLQEFAKWMDWEEFFNLMILNLYFDNKDFPGNNIVMWRPRTSTGRWRWIAKDTDFGLGLYDTKASYNTIAWINEYGYDNYNCSWANGWEHTRLFRRMMEDPDLKREFLDRFAIYMGDFLNEQGVRAIWDPMYEMIKTEYKFHRSLYNPWWPDYSQVLTSSRTWLAQRTGYVYDHLRNYYQLGLLRSMKVNTQLADDDLKKVSISINGIKLTKGIFNGKFFEGRTVTLKGEPADGKRVVKWHVRQVSTQGVVTEQDVEGDSYTFSMPACTSLTIDAVLADATGIATPAITPHPSPNSYYTLDGRKLSTSPTRKGIYIVGGKKVVID